MRSTGSSPAKKSLGILSFISFSFNMHNLEAAPSSDKAKIAAFPTRF
jgi:hypothetical protein